MMDKVKLAIKFPKICDGHGLEYISIVQDKSSIEKNINDWLTNLYCSKKWDNFIVYNDQTKHMNIKKTTKGHCKGIFTWNEDAISWLIHSTPEFPKSFDGTNISNINEGELIYGQSYMYIEIKRINDNLDCLLNQLYNMEPHIYVTHGQIPKYIKKHQMNYLEYQLSDEKIYHISKHSNVHNDIYSYLVDRFGGPCNVETWIRGHKIATSNDNINDIKQVNLSDNKYHYTETHDHSKIAFSSNRDNPWIFFGDLNRMQSQFTRGGGGIILFDTALWLQLSDFFE
jgi:hypothetical protein